MQPGSKRACAPAEVHTDVGIHPVRHAQVHYAVAGQIGGNRFWYEPDAEDLDLVRAKLPPFPPVAASICCDGHSPSLDSDLGGRLIA